ncbi:hypothetical protein Tco_1309772 [Tanacetum coccineum]
MHNNVMAAGSRDRPPMLATGRYAQWQSRFLRYIDTRPNGDALRKCILQAVETILNMSPENKAHYESKNEAIHLLLTRIRVEIYSTVDACKTAHEMWISIERLQQGESLNIQDVNTNLFWEFGKFTSHDGESMESYYSRFYKMMNEMIRNNLTVATMQYQKKVNEIRAEIIAQNANPLALVIAKPITPPSELASEEDSDLEQAQRDKDMRKNLALIVKYFKKIYKPTNNNLETSSNSRNKNVDTSPHYKNNNQTGQFGNQRTVTVTGARETVDSQVLLPRVSNHRIAKELWERIQLLMQGTSLTKQERECRLYDEFDKFTYEKGETLRKGDDPIDVINHMMSFLTAVVTSRYPTTNNQLRNLSKPRQQATINNGRVTLQPVQGRQTSFVAGTTRANTLGASGKVSKLIAENEHLKHTYKQLYNSIKPAHIRSKEQCDDFNLKSVEISDLNASLQKKVLVITALKDDLRKLKGKSKLMTLLRKHTIDPETEFRKLKRVKDSTYHKEKMLRKQAEKGVPLQVEQSDWLANTDEEIDEQELEAHYSFMAKIQEVPTADS